jgi:hypothetical protein
MAEKKKLQVEDLEGKKLDKKETKKVKGKGVVICRTVKQYGMK